MDGTNNLHPGFCKCCEGKQTLDRERRWRKGGNLDGVAREGLTKRRHLLGEIKMRRSRVEEGQSAQAAGRSRRAFLCRIGYFILRVKQRLRSLTRFTF